MPELVWIHAASVGAACEIIIVTGFSMGRGLAVSGGDKISIPSVRGMTRQMRDKEAMVVIVKLIGQSFEMSYVICECLFLPVRVMSGDVEGRCGKRHCVG